MKSDNCGNFCIMVIPNRLVYSLVFLASAVAYSNSFVVPFLFDDYHTIVLNHGIRDLTDPWRAVTGDDPRRPVLFFTFALNYAFGGLDLFGYHAVNLALHVATAVIVFHLLETILTRAGVAGREYPLFGALLFTVHPMNVEAVTYICARSDGLSTFFYYAVFLLYMRGAGSAFGWRGWLALMLYILGLFTKETVVTLPALLVVYTLQFEERDEWRKRWPFIAALLVMLVPYFLYRTAMGGHPLEQKMAAGALTPLEYLATQFTVVPFQYLSRLFVPINQNFDADLGLQESFIAFPVVAGMLVIGLMLAMAFWTFNRRNIYSFSVLWFLGTLSVTSSFYPILDTYVERRLYLANPAFALAITYTLWLATRWRGELKKTLSVSAAALLALFSFLTLQRNAVFSSANSIFEDTVAKTGGKNRMYMALFANYLNQGYVNKAEETIEYAVRAFPGDPDIIFNYCWILGRRGDFAGIERALLKIKPEKGEQWAWYYDFKGVVTAQKGNFEEGLKYFDKALTFSPHHEDAMANRIILLGRMGRVDEAVKSARLALAKKPSSAALHFQLGLLLLRTDRPAAEALFRKAGDIDPYHSGARRMLFALESGAIP